MIRVGFASTAGGCLHYRAELPANVIGLHGDIEARWSGDLALYPGDAPIAIDDDGEDWIPHVMVLAGGLPIGLGAEMIANAQRSGQKIVCDCDDWPWLPKDNPHWQPDCGRLKLAALRQADAVTCSTPFLHDLLARKDIRATLVRNTIDSARYASSRRSNDAWQVNPGGPLTIGYRGLLAGFHDADVRSLGPLPTEHVRYVHVGSDPRSEFSFADLTGLPAELVEERQAVEFDNYGPQLAGIDVALIPLDRRPFSKAKTAIAALEWHAAGVPWLGQGPEFKRAGNGHGVIHRPDDWAKKLERLRDPQARRELFDAQVPPSEPFGERWAQTVLSTMLVPA